LRKKNLLQKIRNNDVSPAALQGGGHRSASGGRASRLTSFLLLFLLIWPLVVALPQQADAYTNPPAYLVDNVTGYTCPGANCGNAISSLSADGGAVCPDPNTGIVTRIVACIQGNVFYAVQNVLGNFIGYMSATIAALCTLAIAAWGFAMATGRRGAPSRDLAVLAMKIAIISLLMGGGINNFSYYFGALIGDGTWANQGMMGELLNLVVGYAHYSNLMYCPRLPTATATPSYYYAWMQVDCMLNTILGVVYSGGTLKAGFVGFLIACFLSGSVGFFIGTIGFIMIFQIIMTVCRACYIYLAAIIGLASVAIVAPIFIPLILFKATKPYYDKWLKLTIGFILQPVFVFIFLTMMLSAFDELMFDPANQYSLYSVIATPSSHFGAIDTDPNYGGFLGQRLMTAQSTYGPSPPLTGPATPCTAAISPYCALSKDNTGLVFHDVTIGQTGGVNIDPGLAMNTITPVMNLPTDTGNMANSSIHQFMDNGAIFQNDITDVQKSFAGQMQTVNGVQANKTVTGINWYGLACLNSVGPNFPYSNQIPADNAGSPNDGGACLEAKADGSHTTERNQGLVLYLIQLFMSLIMALVTAYIFSAMLGYLPFIGQGMIDLNMPILGSGATSMPGGNMFENFKGIAFKK
jgi:type IV secretory pathway VirB6-like protein